MLAEPLILLSFSFLGGGPALPGGGQTLPPPAAEAPASCSAPTSLQATRRDASNFFLFRRLP